MLRYFCLFFFKEDYAINNTSTIANFLSLNFQDIDTIDEIITSEECKIFIKLKRKIECCPFCKSELVKIKEWKQRKIKHSLFYAKPTTFYLKVPRYECKICGKTFTQKQTYSAPLSRTSYETSRLVLENLLKYNETFESVGKLLHLSNTTVQNIFDTYVNPVRGTLPTVLAIDEVYNKGQFSAPYSVVLFNFLKRKVIDVVLDRSKYSLNQYFNKLTREEKNNVRYVIMDMWDPYLDVAKCQFPNAIVAIDSFHVMENIGKAVKDTRCRIMKLYAHGSIEYYLLKNYNYLLYKSPDPWREKEYNSRLKKYVNEYDILQIILNLHNDLRFAHNFYIRYKGFNDTCSYENAQVLFDDYVFDKNGEIIEEFVPIISMLIKWKPYIINSFLIINGTRLSNGPLEGTNSQIKRLLKVGNGYSNFRRFRNRIMHCYNKEIVMSPVENKIAKIPRKKRGNYKKTRQF